MATRELQTRRETNKDGGQREHWQRPRSIVREAEDGDIVVQLEMPGVSKDRLEVTVENNELHITGRREESKPEGEYLLRERRDGSFRRAYTLDETIDPNRVEAAMEAGVLTLTLHRREAVKPRRIPVKAS
jgi:HSP20 family protein